MQLRDYQIDISNRIDAAWAAGNRRVMAVLPTGAGKTVCFSHKINQVQGVRFAIAHRQELISQISMALAKYGIQHNIIASKQLIKWIITLHTRALGRHYFSPSSKVFVCGVRSLLRRADKLAPMIRAARLAVQDECFPAGTLVDGKPIETIKEGDTVTAYCDKTGQFKQRRVTRTFKNRISDYMVRIDIQGHHVLTCTYGHPIFTRRGWVKAGELTLQDEVLHEMHGMRKCHKSTKRSPGLQIQKNRKNILPKSMRLDLPVKEREKTRTKIRKCTLFRMRKNHYCFRLGINSVQKNQQGLLFEGMQCKIPVKNFFNNNGENESKICLRTHEKKQPYASKRSEEKTFQYTKETRSQTAITRRQWPRHDSSTRITGKQIAMSVARTRIHHKNQTKITLPESLQVRHCVPCNTSCNRSRRRIPWVVKETRARQKENRVFEWCRVDRVKVQKSRDIEFPTGCYRDGFVYNIEVEQNHTYIANGTVVHNCHHVTKSNEWGKAVELFPESCKWLFVTATPERSDGKGLGAHASGVVDEMVVGVSMRELIRRGYLTDYRIFAPPNDIDLSSVTIGSTGDYSKPQLTAAARKSHIVGDVVEHYTRLTPGKLGVTFVTDVQTAHDLADAYNAAGVPARPVSAKTPDRERQESVEMLGRGDLKQLVNVDIFGEGFDLPAIEVASMARPTESYGLFVQQFGRALRPMEGKTTATIIDHVGNVKRHGLPDRERQWSLDDREKRQGEKDPDLIPIRTCRECLGVYESFERDCPYCGWEYKPDSRATIEQVEGVLMELDPDTLAEMRGEAERVGEPESVVGDKLRHAGAPHAAVMGAMARHRERREAQHGLRDAMAVWAGYQRAAGQSDAVIQRRFWHRYGMDIMSAQTLGRREAEDLTVRLIRAVE